MISRSARFDSTPVPQAKIGAKHGQDEPSESLIETATRWAHTLVRRMGIGRQWVESEAIGNRPLTTLGVAFSLGVFTGWLIKRR